MGCHTLRILSITWNPSIFQTWRANPKDNWHLSFWKPMVSLIVRKSNPSEWVILSCAAYLADEAHRAPDIPAHVQGLKEELLDFKKVLLRQDVEDILDPVDLGKIPESADSDPLPRHLWTRKDRIRDPNIERSVELMSKAGEHMINMPPEWGWTKLARDFIFKKVERPPGRLVASYVVICVQLTNRS